MNISIKKSITFLMAILALVISAVGVTPAYAGAVGPTLLSFTRLTPASSPTNADTLIFRATFDMSVQNVDATDFVVSGTTTATITGFSSFSSTQYDLTVSGGDLANFNGTVGLDLSGTQNITDLVGPIALPNGEPATDETYTVDNAPVVVRVTSSTPDGYYNVGDNIAISVEFNEIVNVTIGTAPLNYSPGLLLNLGPNFYIVALTGGSGTTTLSGTYPVQAGDTSADLDYSNTISLAVVDPNPPFGVPTTIKDADGTLDKANLSLVDPGTSGSLSYDHAIVVDTTAPDTTIDSKTPATTPTVNTSMAITFSSTEAGSTFECSLDSAAYAGCSSPATYPGLSVGAHTFDVKATDLAGNPDATSATYAWTIVAPTERVLNGGFETYVSTSKIPKSWKAVKFGALDGKDKVNHQAGKTSVKITGAGTTTKTLTQPISFTDGAAGDAFAFSFYVKGSALPKAGTCQISVTLYNAANAKVGTPKIVKCPSTTATFNWKKVTGNITAAAAYTKAVIKITVKKTSGTVWFDGVSLIR